MRSTGRSPAIGGAASRRPPRRRRPSRRQPRGPRATHGGSVRAGVVLVVQQQVGRRRPARRRCGTAGGRRRGSRWRPAAPRWPLCRRRRPGRPRSTALEVARHRARPSTTSDRSMRRPSRRTATPGRARRSRSTTRPARRGRSARRRGRRSAVRSSDSTLRRAARRPRTRPVGRREVLADCWRLATTSAEVVGDGGARPPARRRGRRRPPRRRRPSIGWLRPSAATAQRARHHLRPAPPVQRDQDRVLRSRDGDDEQPSGRSPRPAPPIAPASTWRRRRGSGPRPPGRPAGGPGLGAPPARRRTTHTSLATRAVGRRAHRRVPAPARCRRPSR